MRKIRSSEYKYVSRVTRPTGGPKWRAKPTGVSWGTLHDTEREAALQVDRWLIRHGKEPVNILKKGVSKNEQTC
jgi:hypothetical protein